MVSGFVPVRPATLQRSFFWEEKKVCWRREPRSAGYWLSWETELRHTNGNSSLPVWPTITRGRMWLGHNAEPHSASDMKGPFPCKCFKEMHRDGTRPWRTLFSLGIKKNNNERRKNKKETAGKCSQTPREKAFDVTGGDVRSPVSVRHNVSSVQNLDGTACDLSQNIHHGVTYAVAAASCRARQR